MYSTSLSGFVNSIEFSAACAWYGHLVSGIDAGADDTKDEAIEGLRRLADQIGGGVDFGDVIGEVTSTGDSPTARTQLDLNC